MGTSLLLPGGKVTFHLSATHYVFEADVSGVTGPRYEIIELVRRSRPDSLFDWTP